MATKKRGAKNAGNGIKLVIVESPAKARTIANYLGPGFVVEASIGHIRDLPRNAADVPAKHKGESWARLGVDTENGFSPLYVISPDRKQQVTKLKELLKEASELYLATDEDREGEAIAWHLVETLKPTIPVHRMVFHEITRPAIERAVANPRELNLSLVDAQETRRILDRLYGYEVSPVLWKKVMPKLSAGRVQSVATRIVVERERARMRFTTAEYWDIEAVLAGKGSDFSATLVAVDGDRVATGKDFDAATGELSQQARGVVVRLDEAGAAGLASRLADAAFQVTRVDEKPYRRKPYPPFMTSTLQQEAGRKLRLSSQQTMRVAQKLYENGYITYMRTDSTNLSDAALDAARTQARQLYGPQSVPTEPRRYARKVKNAQEAHEAIRPAGDSFRTPGELANVLAADELKLYDLIWKRTVASQMTDAIGQSVSVRISGTSATGEVADFAVSGKTITEPGFLSAYVESTDDGAESDDSERRLPQLAVGDRLSAQNLEPHGHTTQPPARYTEASLVKAMEELGIGRPSTYASIMQTIQDRGYVWKKGQALVPTFVAFAVAQLLEQHFARLIDYEFTANVEEDLDEVATGELAGTQWLTRFYFGSESGREGGVARLGGLKKMVAENLGDIDARGVNSIPLFDHVVVRVGRYGPYLQRAVEGEEEERASIPEDLPPDELTREKVEELLAAPQGDRELGIHPETDEPVLLKAGRFGPYVQSGEKTGSLFKSMDPETVTLDDGLKLLSLPRVVGKDAEGAEITAQNGRYGPYIKKGTDSRSIETEDQIFSITLDEALAIFAQPKTRGRRAATPPLRELGEDPATGKPMVLKDGRFGPYVTDGETNASLRKGDSVEEITIERGAELLAERRAKGPAKKATKKAAKKTAKKTAAKKTTAKKTATAKKATAKKATAKKASEKD
ncbi:MAG: type I DNA topoisomerase [Corynebacteriales bacterium]|nr:type I DNA topoisomerase [Mycobacteriales bacterium]